MEESTQKEQDVLELVVRVLKEDSAYFYFMLESNEGLSFYSTLDIHAHCPYRDIDIKLHQSTKTDFLILLEILSKELKLELIYSNFMVPFLIETSSVYGPVKSWRFGMSLGIDLLLSSSKCCYNCVYCQLGKIEQHHSLCQEYVPTKKVIRDFKKVLNLNTHFDVITFSGNGEPTLAKNLSEVSNHLRKLAPAKEQIILTNGPMIHKKEVFKTLLSFDRVIIKLDASNQKTWKKINHPAKDLGQTFNEYINNLIAFRKEFKNRLEIQTMIMELKQLNIKEYASIINRITPDSIWLNTPTRPYPVEANIDGRGNHEKNREYKVVELKKISESDAKNLEKALQELIDTPIGSIYR